MKSYVLLAAVAALGVEAQKGGKAKDPYQYKAGDKLPDNINPLELFDKTPSWPSNFGGAKMQMGPAPKGCHPFEIIVARGTSEPGPFGTIVGDPLVARVQRDMGKDKVRGYAVQYDATMASFASPAGPDDIAKRVKNKATECPGMKFAVVGYSQGGGVANNGLGKIPANAKENVLAVVLYAPFMGSSPPKDFAARTLQNCATGDPVCLNGADQSKHISYNTKGTKWHEASTKFIVSAFQGKPLAGNPGKGWTAAWLKAM